MPISTRKTPQRRKLRRSTPASSDTTAFIAYDAKMTKHGAPDGKTSERPECPERIELCYRRLMEMEDDLMEAGSGPVDQRQRRRLIPLKCRPADRREIQLAHTSEHYDSVYATSLMLEDDLRAKTEAEEEPKDLVWNQHTFDAALMAAGSTIQCVDAIFDRGTPTNPTRAIACVRPPGHHACAGSAMGFCYFSNVALAALHALKTKRAKRIVILDWDVHHGNGTQDLTYDNENIMFISLHRFEHDSSFYPGTGRWDEVGSTKAKGFNINIAWTDGGMGDPEYSAALSELVLPVISAFHPDLLLISSGFDAADGDPIGDCSLTPRGYFAMMRSVLKTIGHETPVLAVLEGGYNLEVIPACMEAVALALLDEPFVPAARDLMRADSLPQEVLEDLFGPMDGDDERDEPPKTDEQIDRRATMVRRGTTSGRQELLGFWRHPADSESAYEAEIDSGSEGLPLEAPRNVKPSAIKDINLSMRYLRDCEYWNDLWKLRIVDLHDIPLQEEEDEGGEEEGGRKKDSKEEEDLSSALGTLRIA